MKKNHRSFDEPPFHVALFYGTLWWIAIIGCVWLLVRLFGAQAILIAAACIVIAAITIWRLWAAFGRWIDHYDDQDPAEETHPVREFLAEKASRAADLWLMTRICMVIAIVAIASLFLIGIGGLMELLKFGFFRFNPDPSPK